MQDPRDEYRILNNLIPSSYQDILETEITQRLPWYWTPSASGDVKIDEDDKNVVNFPQMHHVLVDDDGTTSPYFSLIQPIIWFVEKEMRIKIKSLNRIKCNLLMTGDSTLEHYNVPHIDHGSDDHISIVYYVSDSDGDTRIFQNTIEEGHTGLLPIANVAPKKGRAVVFKSNRFHASSPPVKYSNRFVINFVLQIGN